MQTVEQEMGLDAEKDIDLLGVTDLFYEDEGRSEMMWEQES